LACAAACHFGLRDFAIVSLVFGALPIAIGLAFTIAGTESLSYLVAKKRWHEARVVAQEIASWNRVQTPSRIVWKGENEDSDSTFRHAAEMAVDHWGLMRRLFFACVTWMAVGFSYWGLSYSARNISSEPFLNIVLLTGVDAIANFVYPVLAHTSSTMFMQISSFALAGASFYFATRLPDAVLSCVLVARFAISLAFTAVYQSTAEQFPGQFRGTAFGLTSFMERICCSFAPTLSLLPLNVSFRISSAACILACLATHCLYSLPSSETVTFQYMKYT
jgi:OCT family organic cation transporter-like MFS transporter 4/5